MSPVKFQHPPPSLSCTPCTSSSCCLGGAPPSPSWSGVPPLHLLYDIRRECTMLVECCPFALLVWDPPSLPLLHAVRRERTKIWGCHPFTLLVWGPPPLPLLNAMHWKCTLLRGCPPIALLVRGSPLLLPILHDMREVRKLRFDPPSPPSGYTLGSRAAYLGCPPLYTAHTWVVCAAGWGVPPTPLYPGRTLGACDAVAWGPP